MDRIDRTRRRKAKKKRGRDERKRAGKPRRRSPTASSQPNSPSVAPSEDASPLLAQMQSYLTCGELIGTRIPVETILKEIKKLEWSSALFMVASMAAFVANRGGPRSTDALAATRFELSKYAEHHPTVLAIVKALEQLDDGNPTRAIIHEQVLLHLAALVILYAGSSGRRPSGTELTFWALVLNDHLDQPEPTDSSLSSEEVLVAEIIRLGRFNWSHDRAALFARMQQIFKLQPHRGPWKAPEQWDEFKRSAFNVSADEFHRDLFGPSGVSFHHLGAQGERRGAPRPSRGPFEMGWTVLLAKTAPSQRRFPSKPHNGSRATESPTQESAERITLRLPSTFYLKPLVRLDDDRSAFALSPWLLLEQLRIGLWGRPPRCRGDRAQPHRTGHLLSGTCSERWCGQSRNNRSQLSSVLRQVGSSAFCRAILISLRT